MRQLFVALSIFVVLMVGILEERGPDVRLGLVASLSFFPIVWGWHSMSEFMWESRPLTEVVHDDEYERAETLASLTLKEVVTADAYTQPTFAPRTDDEAPAASVSH